MSLARGTTNRNDQPVPATEALTDVAEVRRLMRHLQTFIDSPIGNRCLTCGHVKHNELGYCQVGNCGCGDGTTVAGLAGIVRRDLPAAFTAHLAVEHAGDRA